MSLESELTGYVTTTIEEVATESQEPVVEIEQKYFKKTPKKAKNKSKSPSAGKRGLRHPFKRTVGTQTGEQRFPCDWPGCKFSLSSAKNLERHKAKHKEEDCRFVCDWPDCGKKLTSNKNLKEHKRTHTGEKPFACNWPECGKCFNRKDQLKNHHFTHTGEKPRKCPIPGCDAAFIQLSTLNRHVEAHQKNGVSVASKPRRSKKVQEIETTTVDFTNGTTIYAIPASDQNGGTVLVQVSPSHLQSLLSSQTLFATHVEASEAAAYLARSEDGVVETTDNVEYNVIFRTE